MAAKILKMSDAKTMKFLKLYQNEPILWDLTRDDYKKRDARAAAAERIATAMEIEGFTGVHVMLKFKNLRSSYAQEIKKIAKSKKSGCSSDEVYIPKVTWFKFMDSFIKPHVKSRKRESMEDPVNKNVPCIDNLSIELPIFKVEDDEPQQQENNSLQIEADVDQNQPSTSKETGSQNMPLKRKNMLPTAPYKKKLADNISLSSANEKLNEISNSTVGKEDSFDHFGRYIASILRSLPNDRSSQLQADIVSMILSPSSSSSIYK